MVVQQCHRSRPPWVKRQLVGVVIGLQQIPCVWAESSHGGCVRVAVGYQPVHGDHGPFIGLAARHDEELRGHEARSIHRAESRFKIRRRHHQLPNKPAKRFASHLGSFEILGHEVKWSGVLLESPAAIPHASVDACPQSPLDGGEHRYTVHEVDCLIGDVRPVFDSTPWHSKLEAVVHVPAMDHRPVVIHSQQTSTQRRRLQLVKSIAQNQHLIIVVCAIQHIYDAPQLGQDLVACIGLENS
mmetsp:Transcript_30674/g.70851  ORF Transcript_30674/g.70851 Transcript_30674/m.70851 type:complete len:242 (-) Transcript_30674:262-987(-)